MQKSCSMYIFCDADDGLFCVLERVSTLKSEFLVLHEFMLLLLFFFHAATTKLMNEGKNAGMFLGLKLRKCDSANRID